MPETQNAQALSDADLDAAVGGAVSGDRPQAGLTTRFGQAGQDLDSSGAANVGAVKGASPIQGQGGGTSGSRGT